MLEERTYSKSEIESALSTFKRETVKKKLERYNIEYTIEGRGNYLTTINKISNPFKLFCILDLGFPAQCDFDKLRDFIYYFLNDNEFQLLPDEKKEIVMSSYGTEVSRQTMAKWQEYLVKNNMMTRSSEFNYYFSYKGTIINTDEDTYKKAWSCYWSGLDKYQDYTLARMEVIARYGGIPRKHPKPTFNAFTIDKYNTLNELATKSFLES